MNFVKFNFSDVTEYDKKLCLLFAKYCVRTNKAEYDTRGQDNEKKVIRDIYNGKLAEIMVHTVLQSNNMSPSSIDFMIYDKKYKSFDADIVTQNKNIHVKSCMGDNKFPNSWLFQPYDRLVTNPTDHDVIFLVVLNKTNSYGYMIKASSDIVYKKPLASYLDKAVIYEEDII